MGRRRSSSISPWPEVQLTLPDLGSDPEPVDHRNASQALTKGGRVVEKKKVIDRSIPCPKCGNPKTQGLPCPHCTGAQE